MRRRYGDARGKPLAVPDTDCGTRAVLRVPPTQNVILFVGRDTWSRR